jgi:hypothetical protein
MRSLAGGIGQKIGYGAQSIHTTLNVAQYTKSKRVLSTKESK